MEIDNKTIKGTIYKISPKAIVVVDGFNSRSSFGDLDELAAQIKEQGVLNPISVIPFKDENGEEKYRLVDGERRYRAVMKLLDSGVEIARIPALFLSKSTSEEELLIQQALRNEGKPFNPYEWAILAKKMMDKCGLNLTEVANKLGKNVGSISRYLGYLELSPKLSSLIRDDIISGANLDRVLNAYGGDEEAAYNELMGLKQKMKEKGRNKISLKDCTLDSDALIYKDSITIKKGLEALMRYVKQYTNPNGKDIDIQLDDVLKGLNADKNIKVIFDEFKAKAYDEQVS